MIYYLLNLYLPFLLLTILMDYLSHCTYARLTRFLVCPSCSKRDILFVITGILAKIDIFFDHAIVEVSTSMDV
jgi:hypothetical protein